ncbi:MAG: YIP1 family protein [Promethearchaeota archaeon]
MELVIKIAHATEEDPNNNLKDHNSEENFYLALNHEVRRTIIKMAGDQENVGFSQIKKATGVSTGTIYHHLETLQDFLTQNKKKKYQLTPLGEHAYKFLTQNRDSIELMKEPANLPGFHPKNKLIQRLLFQNLFHYFIDHINHGLIISHAMVLLIGILCGVFNIQSVLFFYNPVESWWTGALNSIFLERLLIFFSVILGYYLLFGITELIARFVFNKEGQLKSLLCMIGLSYLPLLIYVLFLVLVKIFPVPLDSLLFLIRFLLIIFQIWAMILLAKGVSLVKHLSFEKSLMVAIFIDYGTFMILLLANVPML